MCSRYGVENQLRGVVFKKNRLRDFSNTINQLDQNGVDGVDFFTGSLSRARARTCELIDGKIDSFDSVGSARPWVKSKILNYSTA